MRLFRRKKEVEAPIVNPTEIDPKTAPDFIKRGYAFHARGDQINAEADIRKAISMDSGDPEAHYALALTLKSQDRKEDAVAAFKAALIELENLEKDDPIKAHMLTRLTKGHINQLTKGDWDLRKDFWGFEE